MKHSLTNYRKANKLSMQEVADAIGVNASAIFRWENGERTPRLFHIRKIEEFTQGAVSAADFEPQDETA